MMPSAYGTAASSAYGAAASYDAPARAAPSRVSSNAYASGANQNAGNGIVDGRPTTRLLAPPGGRTSIVLG
jgi:hypothetical protein